MELPYRIVDVFSDRPLAGNGLCVVAVDDPTAVSDGLMAAIAREVNLSETTFVTRTGDGRYDVRIWTTVGELPFAGHPSLGSAWTLGPGTWTQRSPGATVTVEVSRDRAVMTQPDPHFTEVYPEDAAAGLGLGASQARTAYVAEVGGTRHLLVPTTADLAGLRPDEAALGRAAAAVRATGVGAFRRRYDGSLQVRLFVPGAGFGEDPGTGSAAGPIGVLARRLWGPAEDVVISQGVEMGRPCRIEVHAGEGAVRVAGAVTACAEGRFTL